MRALAAVAILALLAGCVADCGNARVQGMAWTQPGIFDAIRNSTLQPVQRLSASGIDADLGALAETYRAPVLTDVLWTQGNVTLSATRAGLRAQVPHKATNESLRAWVGDFAAALNASVDADALLAARQPTLFAVSPGGAQEPAFDEANAPWRSPPNATALVTRWAADADRAQTHPGIGAAALGTGAWGLLLKIPIAVASLGNWTISADVLDAVHARGPDVATIQEARAGVSRELAAAGLPNATFGEARPEYGPVC